jgi:hypothetical protein
METITSMKRPVFGIWHDVVVGLVGLASVAFLFIAAADKC